MNRFVDRVVVVTGAGSGIGRAAAKVFAAEGAAVAVVDLSLPAAEETVGAISSDGGRGLAVRADVTVNADVEVALDQVVAAFGGVHALFNNAGCESSGSIVDAGEDDWDRAIAVNAKGTFLCSRAAIAHLKRSGGGAIVNQASVAALVGVPRMASYCAAKGAVVALTRAMAIDHAPDNVRVNVICPGTVSTPLIEPILRARGEGDVGRGLKKTLLKYPLGRLGTPAEIAHVAAFLASDEASFITGSVIAADGGMTAQ